MAEQHERRRLQLENYEPLPRPEEEAAQKIAAELGFASREIPASLPIDGRMYRRPTERTTQLNIAVRPALKDQFWRLAYDLRVNSGEELLVKLLDAFAEQSPRPALKVAAK
ncbi:MAG: hypothetical protein ACK4NE_07515 [Albidovulum sp.]